MSFNPSQLRGFATSEDAAAFVAAEVQKACHDAIAKRGVFHWVLAGGSTPEQCYRMLRVAEMDWGKVHIWFGDERALEAGHPDRNETMARAALLDYVPIAEGHIHSLDFGHGTKTAAEAYTQEISNVECFDLVMLGMGEDGHTASLFPNHETLQSDALAVAEYDSPKPPAERVSMGLKALNNHRQCFILATGSAKNEPLKALVQGADLPVGRIQGATWVVDQAAWPE